MNNSFEQFLKKANNSRQATNKNGANTIPNFKKEVKRNVISKNKNNPSLNEAKYQNQLFNCSVISNNSLQKNLSKMYTSKSNHKRSKRQDNQSSKSKQNNLFKKCPAIQLSKKQRQIREAIQYRFQKSKMKIYKFTCPESRSDQFDDSKVKEIIDLEEQQRFAQLFGYLADFKLVNLYEYHQFKEQEALAKRQRSGNKIIVIKNSKKKRQNSDTAVSFNYKVGENQGVKGPNNRLVANPSNYFSNDPLNVQSQRNYTQVQAPGNHHRNKSESPAQSFRFQFPLSKAFHKQKSGSRTKIMTQPNSGTNQNMNLSSSVQKNFKSIKDIYLSAINSLTNKNTVKSNTKLFKNQNSIKNKASNTVLYQSDKKGRIQLNQNRHQKNLNNSSSAHHQNYFSCISSREHPKDQKNNFTYNNRKTTKQKLQKTLLINQTNPSQWKSIIMKVGQNHQCNTEDGQLKTDNKKFRLKLKDQGISLKVHKNVHHNKYIPHPHSYRQYIKSPKFKRFIVSDQDQIFLRKKPQQKKNVSSANNINQSYQFLLNSSQASLTNNQVHYGSRKNKK